jgi:hypothetical protein
MTTAATHGFPLRVIAFVAMQTGTALSFIFAAHLLVFSTMPETWTWLPTASAALAVFLYLPTLFKAIKKAHTWRDTIRYWTTYDVEFARKNAAGAFLFLLGAAAGAATIAFRLWPEICGALASLALSWGIIWFLARKPKN